MVAGWYDDPADARLLRWWDGQAWTDHTRPRPPTPAPAPATFEPTTQLRQAAVAPPTAAAPPRAGAPIPFAPAPTFDAPASAPAPVPVHGFAPGPTPVARPAAPRPVVRPASARGPQPRLGAGAASVGVTVCLLAGVLAFLVARAVAGG